VDCQTNAPQAETVEKFFELFKDPEKRGEKILKLKVGQLGGVENELTRRTGLRRTILRTRIRRCTTISAMRCQFRTIRGERA
jgi:hypothetical protein